LLRQGRQSAAASEISKDAEMMSGFGGVQINAERPLVADFITRDPKDAS
jgi:hypothetical protein